MLRNWVDDRALPPHGKETITRVLFQSRHDWFRPHQYRYCVGYCDGAVLVKQLGDIAKFLAISPTFQHQPSRPKPTG